MLMVLCSPDAVTPMMALTKAQLVEIIADRNGFTNYPVIFFKFDLRTAL